MDTPDRPETTPAPARPPYEPPVYDPKDALDLVSQVLDLLPDFFYVHDFDLRFCYANRKAAEYFGTTKADLLGRTLEEVDFNKEQAAYFKEVCRHVMLEGVPRLTDRLPYVRPDGTPGFLRQFDVPFRGSDGEPLLIGLSRDVTDEIRAEEERRTRALLEREMQIARDIQTALTPRDPAIPGCDLATHSTPADYAGGDFVHWTHARDGTLIVGLGDVSGHGVGTAILAATTRAYARVLADGTPFDALLDALNRRLADDLTLGRFVTYAAARFDPRDGTLLFASAGHGPVFLRRASGTVEILPTHALPLGITQPLHPEPPTRYRLAPSDSLILISDGIIEAADPAGVQYGTEHLRRILADTADSDARAIVDRVMSSATSHLAGARPADDATIAVLRRTP
jgi:PAS domain S-box-containing protein